MTILKLIIFIIPILWGRRKAKKMTKLKNKNSPKYNFDKAHRNLQKNCRRVAIIKKVKYEVINAPKDGKYIIVANHSDFFDILALVQENPIKTTFVSKKEVADSWLVRPWAESIGVYFIDREDVRQSLRELRKVEKDFVDHNHSVTIFPEGTRNEVFGEFKPGAFKTATNLEATILPLAIINAKREKDANGKKVIKLVFGKPIKTTKKSDLDELSNECHSFIKESLDKYAISKKSK